MVVKQAAPEYWREPKEHVRKVAQVVNELLQGRSNAGLTVELAATPATETKIIQVSARSEMQVQLSPMSSAAATDFAAGTTYATVADGEVTITHAAGASGRKYGVLLQG